MEFHSIPELYVRLRIPFDTQTWLKKKQIGVLCFSQMPMVNSCHVNSMAQLKPTAKAKAPLCGRVVFRSVVDGSEM